MIETNFYFWWITALLIGFYFLDLALDLLNLGAMRSDVPEEMREWYDPETYRQSQAYTRTKTQLGWLESTIQLVVLLAFWWLGGFAWLSGWVQQWGWSVIPSGLLFFGILIVGGKLIELPFDLYRTFVIEEKFGFNKTTGSTFFTDLLKGLLLGAALGGVLGALVMGYFEYGGSLAWLWAWLVCVAIMLGMVYVAPIWIMPLFNKFTPLPEGELKEAILAYGQRHAFPVKEILVMDGSKRSAKANAFFTGWGKNKRIALFDTLIANHSVPELVAVLAHEVGHDKKKHILQHLILSVANLGLLFFLASLFIHSVPLHLAFGVQEPAVYTGLFFFSLVLEPLQRVLSVILGIWTRRHEFEADRFAAETTGNAEAMILALKKLSKDTLSNLTPHPLYVFFYYSHPPLMERIAALRTKNG